MTQDDQGFQRRRPRQARSKATYDSILEAAAQVLARDGAAGLTTNRVAERAGVSIGTLYQYFPDKTAILLATARQALGRASGPQQGLLEALVGIIEGLLGGGATAVPVGKRGLARSAARTTSAETLERLALRWFGVLTPAPVLVRVRR